MRTLYLVVATIFLFSISGISQEISPFIKVGESGHTVSVMSGTIKNVLKSHNFEVLGDYNPASNPNLGVIAFTRNDLKNTVVKVKDRGALAAVLKIGLVKEGNTLTISYTNPEYILRAYLGNDYGKYETLFTSFSNDVKKALSQFGNDFTPFGGAVEKDKLKKYHYKIMMPYFTDPVELREFASFEEGVATIEKNLKAKKGNTVLVYKLVYSSPKVAVFGVGLEDDEDGESHFLPKIGEAHAAALPYEIILQGKTATMLHGKYRIALHWPDLTMGTFMKIMSTPGDIEDALEELCN